MRRSSYRVARVAAKFIWIVDEDGPLSVTNDAERVVQEVVRKYGDLRIIYRDTSGDWDELVHEGERFKGFAPARDLALPAHVATDGEAACDRCGRRFDDDDPGPDLCHGCNAVLAEEQEADDRADDPRRGQAMDINRGIG